MGENQEKISFTDNLTIRFDGENYIDFQQLFGYISGIRSCIQGEFRC